MKKTMKKVAATTTKVTKPQATLVKPTMNYTRAEVGRFLGLSKGSSVCPSKYGMAVVDGKIAGRSVIAYLESGKCRKAKVGRKYASGTITVVAR